MALTRLRQQGGAVVLTIPGDVAAVMGWSVGTELDVKVSGYAVSIQPVKQVARGRKSLADLLNGINEKEIARFNEDMRDDLASVPKGREAI
jgi:antitoxin ChpS